jgi:thioredoxin-dependent peroxiredoxin
MMKALNSKDKAPGFNLENQKGQNVSLSDFSGKKLFLYFYPKANTSGWATQAKNVRDVLEQLKGRNIAVIGISPDKPETQKKFDDKHNLGFSLLSDPDHKVAQAYGVWGEKKMYGKTFMGIVRSSFLIDKNGTIEHAWYKISPKDTVPELMKVLD